MRTQALATAMCCSPTSSNGAVAEQSRSSHGVRVKSQRPALAGTRGLPHRQLRRPQLPLPHVTSNAAYFRPMRQRGDQKTVRTYCAAVQTNAKHELLQDRHIDMYDTTLRDGAQMVGISLTTADKLLIAQKLCRLGVAYIEGGWPGSNPKDQGFFKRWDEIKDKGATKLSAFGSTRHKNKTCKQDPQVQALVACGAPVICIVAKAWDEQVEQVIEATLEQNLAMIQDTVEYLVKAEREVMVDLEHFFDGCTASGMRGEGEYANLCLRTAAAAGATTIVLCDTNGGAMPWTVEERTVRAVEAVAEWPNVQIGIHCHNDTGLAVANSLCAVRAGAKLVQGCINGYGERTGNADLITVIGDLQVKMGYSAIHPENLYLLTSVASEVAAACAQPPPGGNPFVGTRAFAHKGGLHVAAVRKLPHSYNHMEPALVGNQMQAVVSELSGKGNVLSHAEQAGFNLDEQAAKTLLQRIKQMEQSGYSFEGASASVNMMILRSRMDYMQPFRVVEYSVISQNREKTLMRKTGGGDSLVPSSFSELEDEENTTNQAMLKVYVQDKLSDQKLLVMHAAEGNGPVDALVRALRSALLPYYTCLASCQLVDYNVRLLDTAGSESVTRVTVEFFDDATGKSWSTVGAHTSIIEASFRAITDGLEFGVLNSDADCQEFSECVVKWEESQHNGTVAADKGEDDASDASSTILPVG